MDFEEQLLIGGLLMTIAVLSASHAHACPVSAHCAWLRAGRPAAATARRSQQFNGDGNRLGPAVQGRPLFIPGAL